MKAINTVYAVSNDASSFWVKGYKSLDDMMDDLNPAAFYQYEGVESPELGCLCNPSPAMRKYLEVAEAAMATQFWFKDALLKRGGQLSHGMAADYIMLEGVMYLCIRHDRFIRAKDHARLCQMIIDLPMLEEYTDDGLACHSLAKEVSHWMTLSRVSTPIVLTGSDFDIPF